MHLSDEDLKLIAQACEKWAGEIKLLGLSAQAIAYSGLARQDMRETYDALTVLTERCRSELEERQ